MLSIHLFSAHLLTGALYIQASAQSKVPLTELSQRNQNAVRVLSKLFYRGCRNGSELYCCLVAHDWGLRCGPNAFSFFPCVCVGFLWVFLPHSMLFRWMGDSKLPIVCKWMCMPMWMPYNDLTSCLRAMHSLLKKCPDIANIARGLIDVLAGIHINL